MTDCIFCRTNECPFCKAKSMPNKIAYNSDLHSMIDSDLTGSSYRENSGAYKSGAGRYLGVAEKYNASGEVYTHADSQSNSGDYSGGENLK